MPRLNSCPVMLATPFTGELRPCNQQLEFFGIAHYRIPQGIPGAGKTITARWRQCTSCSMMSVDNFGSRILHSRKPFSKDEIERWFPTTREKRERGPRKAAASA
jgi:hypothetical protein